MEDGERATVPMDGLFVCLVMERKIVCLVMERKRRAGLDRAGV